MKLTTIGCTGSMSGPKSPASCYLVQANGVDPSTGEDRVWNVVLEMGPGSFGALWRRISPRDIDAVVLSHCHADHMADIISLQVYRKWGPGSDLPPLMVVGPEGLLERIRQIDGVVEEELYANEFDIRTVEDGQSYQIGPMTLTSFKGIHTIPSFGTRIEGPSQSDPSTAVSMFFTGDTDESPRIDAGAMNVDLLLTEIGFTCEDSVRGIHMDGVRAGSFATRANVGRLVATHIQPWTETEQVLAELRQTWSGPVDFACLESSFVVGGK